MNITSIIIGLIALHFVVGFGYLIYKLSPQKGDAEKLENQNQEDNQEKNQEL